MSNQTDEIRTTAPPEIGTARTEAFVRGSDGLLKVQLSRVANRYPDVSVTDNGCLVRVANERKGDRVGIIIVDQIYDLEFAQGIEEQIIAAATDGRDLSHLNETALKAEKARIIKTVRGNARNELRYQMYRDAGLEVRQADTSDALRRVQAAFNIPGMRDGAFIDPVYTSQLYDTLIRDLFREAVMSGAFLQFPDLLRDATGRVNITFDTFVANLARVTNPEGVLMSVAMHIDRMNGLEFPEFMPQTHTPQPRTEREPQGPQRQGDPKQRGAMGNVTGVAQVLGLHDIIIPIAEVDPDRWGRRETWYGTTDFGNPVEAIMTAVVAERAAAPGMYTTDQESHTVGSYLHRILIPTISALSHLNETERAGLEQLARQLEHRLDIGLDELARIDSSGLVSRYLFGLRDRFHIEAETFTQLYEGMNDLLAERLGIRHVTAKDIFTELYPLTVGDLVRAVEEMSPAINARLEEIRAQLIAEHGEQNGAVAFRNLFGSSGSWDGMSRKFIRSIRDDQEVRLDTIPPETRLSDLGRLGYTLGGNAWVVAMQVISESDHHPGIVVAHKNTAQGANYALAGVTATKTRYALSPVVRVVPNGGSGATGDGLDIGLYLHRPELVQLIANLMTRNISEITSGRYKYVVSVGIRNVYTKSGRRDVVGVSVYKVPTHQGRLDRPEERYYFTLD